MDAQVLIAANGILLALAGLSMVLTRRRFGGFLERLAEGGFFRPLKNVASRVNGEFKGERTATRLGVLVMMFGVFMVIFSR